MLTIETYPGVWRHSYFIAMHLRTEGIHNPQPQVRTPPYSLLACTDVLTLFDTSDGVLNPSGVRFGSG